MPNRTRVLLAIGSMSGGGAERQVLRILQHLDRTRFEPLLYLVRREGEFLEQVPEDVPVFAFSDEYRTPCINFPGRIHRMQVAHLARLLKEQEVNLVYDRTYLMTLITAAATRRQRVPRVSAVACDPKNDFAATAGRFQRMKRRLLRRGYLEADRVVAVSDGVRCATADFYGIPRERVEMLPNLYDLGAIGRLAEEPFSLPMPDERFHVVATGRLSPQKGFGQLIHACGKLIRHRNRCHLHLWLLGQGPLEAELRDTVASLELTEHVHFEGFVANPFAWYRHARLFCLSSLYEGFPNVLIEAMACGAPVVATDCPSGPREILLNGKYGRLVPPDDAVALADAIEQVMDDYDAARQVATAAKTYVEESFGLETGLQKLQDLFLQVVREHRVQQTA